MESMQECRRTIGDCQWIERIRVGRWRKMIAFWKIRISCRTTSSHDVVRHGSPEHGKLASPLSQRLLRHRREKLHRSKDPEQLINREAKAEPALIEIVGPIQTEDPGARIHPQAKTGGRME